MKIEITASFYKRKALIDFITEINRLANGYSGPLTIKFELSTDEQVKKGK